MKNIPFDRLYNEHISNSVHDKVPMLDQQASTFSLGDRLTVVQIDNPHRSLERLQ